MKKTVLILASIILVGFALAGCSDGGESFRKRSYTSHTKIDEIHLDVRDREIEVSLSDDERIHIECYESRGEHYDISISDESILTVMSASVREWRDYIGVKPAAGYRKISLQIPNALLDALTISTTNGDITIADPTAVKKMRLSANNGDIIFGNLDVGSALDLAVKNGNVSGTIIGSRDDFTIHSKIKKGKSNLRDNPYIGEKTLNVSCNNGNVSINFQN